MSEAALVAGGISIMPPSAENMQLSMLLWGDSGSGKTTLAATAPGTKLYLLFDPGGDLSLAGRVDVLVLDLSAESSTKVMAQFRAADPYNLGKILQSDPTLRQSWSIA
jgi:septin family protein